MAELNLFIPLTKIDAEKRIVYGVATAETLDRSGEICDYASTKPFYEKWSNGIAKATGGKSLGNLRAMHGKVAAGKLIDIGFNDDAKQIEVAAKVVDDDEWKKVEEGVYTGFSHGGRYVKKWTGTDGAKRYTAEPSELSLVDYPCVPEAVFEVIKADGSEMRKFTPKPEPTEADLATRAFEIGKAQPGIAYEDAIALAKAERIEADLHKAEIDTGAAEGESVEKTETAVEAQAEETAVEEAVEKTEDPKDGKKPGWVEPVRKSYWSCNCEGHEHVTKAEAVACMKDALAKQTADELPEVVAARLALEKLQGAVGDGGTVLVVTREALEKLIGEEVWDSAAAMRALDMLFSVRAKEAAEPDNEAAQVASLDSAIAGVKAFIASEIMEDNSDDSDDAAFAMAARDYLAKRGARNSKTDLASIQAIHDHCAQLGAKCAESEEGAEKAAATGELAKVVSENEVLKSAISSLTQQMGDLAKAVEVLKAQPAPARAAVFAVSKAADGAAEGEQPKAAEDALVEKLNAMTPEQRAYELTKLSLRVPVAVVR
jgi:hypothetical protein